MISKIKGMLRGEIAHNASRMLVLQFLTMIVGFIFSVIVARVLGPEEKGKVDLFLLLTNYIIEFGMLGAGTGFLYYQTNKKEKLEYIHGTSLLFCCMMGVLIFVIGLLFLDKIELLFIGVERKYIILAFCIAPILLYRQISGNIIQGLNKPQFSYKITLIVSVFTFVLVALAGVTGNIEYYHMIIFNVLGFVLQIICALHIIFKQTRKLHIDYILLKRVMKYGIAIYIGALANSLLFRMDQNFLNYYWGSEAVGCYAVAVNFAELLWSFDGIINAVTLYHIASNEAKTAIKLLKKTVIVQMIISCSLGGLLEIFAPVLINVLYGQEYVDAIAGIRILVPGIVVWSVGRLFSQYITLNIGKPFLCTIATVCGIMVNYILNHIFIPTNGIKGAAGASVVSYFVVVLVVLIFFKVKGVKYE